VINYNILLGVGSKFIWVSISGPSGVMLSRSY